MPVIDPSQHIRDIAKKSPYWNDKMFVIGYLKAHIQTYEAQLSVLPRAINTPSDRITEKFAQQMAYDMKFLSDHLHELVNGETPITDEELAHRFAGVDFQPVLKVE